MNCPQCGNPVEKDAKFCPKCFARIEPPGLLRRMASFLQSLTRPGTHVLFKSEKRTFATVDREGNRHVYRSLDEVPPSQRSEMEKLESELRKEFKPVLLVDSEPPVIVKDSATLYRIRDASGQECVYHSLDQLPPEMRILLEKKAEGIRRKTITVYRVKDASGQEHVYHSHDELPPEIRAALEKAQIKTDWGETL